MSKFIDKYPLNANIEIDYLNKKVDFSYNGDYKSFWERFRWVFMSMRTFCVLLFLVPLVVLGLVTSWYMDSLPFFSVWERTGMLGYLAGLCMICFYAIPFALAYLITDNYHLFHEIFPKLNAWMITKFRVKKRVLFDDITGKQAEIPFFSNIVIEYELTGDYAKYLSGVKIVGYPYKQLNIWGKWKKQQSAFKCVFEFIRVPKKGKLYVEYL